jgi:hypothetical protein
MNSQEFRQAARTAFALAMDAYYAVSNDDNATMEQLIAADVAKTAADAQWIADQHTANTMSQAELDAATAKGCEEVAAEVTAEATAEAFGTAWGADGQVLSHAETVEAIANRHGWFDVQGRWVNYARMMQEARAMLAAN